MPVVRKLDSGLWEIRSQLNKRIARVLFTTCSGKMILLHGFIKKSRKTPAVDIKLANRRKANLEVVDG
jgi:phage-related protein